MRAWLQQQPQIFALPNAVNKFCLFMYAYVWVNLCVCMCAPHIGKELILHKIMWQESSRGVVDVGKWRSTKAASNSNRNSSSKKNCIGIASEAFPKALKSMKPHQYAWMLLCWLFLASPHPCVSALGFSTLILIVVVVVFHLVIAGTVIVTMAWAMLVGSN